MLIHILDRGAQAHFQSPVGRDSSRETIEASRLHLARMCKKSSFST